MSTPLSEKSARQVKTVLLVNPPDPGLLSGGLGYMYFEPPLGLLYVHTYLKQRPDLDVRVVDLNIEYSAVRDEKTLSALIQEHCREVQPDLVSIAALYYSGIETFHTVAQLFREHAPHSVITMGGHYPTHLTELCLADPVVDYAILSEGETGLSDLIDALNAGRPLDLVEGVGFRTPEGVQKNPRITFWKQYATSPRLDYGSLDFHKYFKSGRQVLDRLHKSGEIRMATLTATRGCPNKCAFCSSPTFWRRRWRPRDVQMVVDEIRHLRDNFGANTFLFNDENICANLRWFNEFLDAITPLGIRWMSYGGLQVRPLADRSLVAKMYKSGICLFNLAIESGNDATLQRIYKPLTIEQTAQAVGNIRALGDGYMTGFFITGFHFETRADVQKTLDFAASLPIDWKCFYCFQPFPGSELYQDCLREGIIDSFNPNYGENYYAPSLKHLDYTDAELQDMNYFANLRLNFLGNINLLAGTAQGQAQARRDFEYVESMASGHVFALHGLARLDALEGNPQAARAHLLKAKTAFEQKKDYWTPYLNGLGVDLDQEYRRACQQAEGHPSGDNQHRQQA